MKITKFKLRIVDHDSDKEFPVGLEIFGMADEKPLMFRASFDYKIGDKAVDVETFNSALRRVVNKWINCTEYIEENQ